MNESKRKRLNVYFLIYFNRKYDFRIKKIRYADDHV